MSPNILQRTCLPGSLSLCQEKTVFLHLFFLFEKNICHWLLLQQLLLVFAILVNTKLISRCQENRGRNNKVGSRCFQGHSRKKICGSVCRWRRVQGVEKGSYHEGCTLGHVEVERKSPCMYILALCSSPFHVLSVILLFTKEGYFFIFAAIMFNTFCTY